MKISKWKQCGYRDPIWRNEPENDVEIWSGISNNSDVFTVLLKRRTRKYMVSPNSENGDYEFSCALDLTDNLEKIFKIENPIECFEWIFGDNNINSVQINDYEQ